MSILLRPYAFLVVQLSLHFLTFTTTVTAATTTTTTSTVKYEDDDYSLAITSVTNTYYGDATNVEDIDTTTTTDNYANGVESGETTIIPTATLFEGNSDENETTTTTTFVDNVVQQEEDVSEKTSPVQNISPSTSKPQIRYDGYQILNVATVNSKERRKIQELEKRDAAERLATYVTGVHLLIKKEDLPLVKETLLNNSMAFEVLIDDVQRTIDSENPPVNEDMFDNRKGHRLTFQHYHRMADIHGYLDYLSATRSDFVSVETIGNSLEGRPLKVVKISSGKPNATAMWIDGGIHAREWIAVSTVLYIVNEFVENRENLDEEIQNTDYYLLPIVNPDGYEYSHERERLWRKNRRKSFGSFCSGVDLNRNWAYEWGGKGAGKIPCVETYAGSSASSEPETKAISKYILQNPSQFKGFVTFHSYGQYILYPWGYAKKYTSDYEALDRVGRLAASAIKQATGSTYTVGNSASLLYPASGASDDWAKGIAKIKYAYTIELRDTGRYGFILPSSEILPAGKEGLAAVKAITKELNT